MERFRRRLFPGSQDYDSMNWMVDYPEGTFEWYNGEISSRMFTQTVSESGVRHGRCAVNSDTGFWHDYSSGTQ